MIVGGTYPGGYTPLGVPAAPQVVYTPRFGALRVALGKAISPPIARIIGQFGVDAILYVADRSTKNLDGSTHNAAWLAIPGVVPVVLSAVTEQDRIREYGSDEGIDMEGQMPIPSGVPIVPGMGLLVKAGLFTNASFRIVVVRPTEVANVVRIALVRLQTPIA